jgi:hypothetical protein
MTRLIRLKDVENLAEMFLKEHGLEWKDISFDPAYGYLQGVSPVMQIYRRFGLGPRPLKDIKWLIEDGFYADVGNGKDICAAARRVFDIYEKRPEDIPLEAAPQKTYDPILITRDSSERRALEKGYIGRPENDYRACPDYKIIARWLLTL